MKTLLVLFVLLFGAGCASSVTQNGGYSFDLNLMSSQTRTRLATNVQPPLPTKTVDTANTGARADHLVGSIAGSLGVAQHELDSARSAKLTAQASCIEPKLNELVGIERQARDRRAAIRLAEDDEGAQSIFSQLESHEARARQVRNELATCLQFRQLAVTAYLRHEKKAEDEDGTEDTDGAPEPDRDADGIVDQVDKMPDEPALGPMKARTVEEKVAQISAGNHAVAVTTQQHDASMIIHTAELALAVYEVAKNIQAVEKSTTELGGYLSLRSDREITVRVPRDKFQELVSRIEKMGDVLHKNIAAEDVTDQYVDLDMRLRNATAVRERLEKLLAGATVKDAVEIHKELSKVTEEIERYEGKLKLLRDRIAYSTITVTFEQQQSQSVKSQALLPFPWMSTMGLSPLLQVQR